MCTYVWKEKTNSAATSGQWLRSNFLLVQQRGLVTYDVILNSAFDVSKKQAHAWPAWIPAATGRSLTQPRSNKQSKSWIALADTFSWDGAVIPTLGHLPVPRPRITESMAGNNNFRAEKDQLLNCCNLQANTWMKTRPSFSLL